MDKTAHPPKEPGESRPSLKLSRLLDTVTDDIEAYLITFERSMGAYEVDKSRWTCLLAGSTNWQSTAAAGICSYDS